MWTSPNSQNCQSQVGSLNGTSSTPSLVSSSADRTVGFGDRRPCNKRKPFPSKWKEGGRKPKKEKKEVEERRIEMGSVNSTEDGEILTPGHGFGDTIATSHPNTPQLRCSQDSSTVISLHTFPRKSGKPFLHHLNHKYFIHASRERKIVIP